MPVLKGARTPSAVAVRMPIPMAGTRPMRSATIDHGTTAAARPSVAADTASAAVAGVIPRFDESCGSTACGEYSCANVAMPAKNSPTMRRR